MGCASDQVQLLRQSEDVLPGDWNIVSIQLPKYGTGVTYQGNTFITDTILYDVGSIYISEFSADTLSLQNISQSVVSCTLQIGDEYFPYGLDALFISGDEIFSGFTYNGPAGIDTINTPGKAFIWSSYVFNNNYFISILDENHVVLSKASDRNNHKITLQR